MKSYQEHAHAWVHLTLTDSVQK